MNGIGVPLVIEPRLPWHTLTTLPNMNVMEALSPREMEVLLSFARDGESNTAIGNELFIDERTVRSHFIALFAKFHATTRTQVVLRALRWGVLAELSGLTPTARVMLSFIRANPDAFLELLAAGALGMYAEVTP